MTTESKSGVIAVELAVELTTAWLANGQTRASADDVPAFLAAMRNSVSQLIAGPAEPKANELPPAFTPAVSARKSLASKDHIISMIDGKPYKTLRRHLTGHGLTPEEYRRRYNLKADYPLVAEAYSAARRAMAKEIGLGRKRASSVSPNEPTTRKRQKLTLPPVTD